MTRPGSFESCPNFVVQWGINKDPKVSRQWSQNFIPDDPVKESNHRGLHHLR